MKSFSKTVTIGEAWTQIVAVCSPVLRFATIADHANVLGNSFFNFSCYENSRIRWWC